MSQSLRQAHWDRMMGFLAKGEFPSNAITNPLLSVQETLLQHTIQRILDDDEADDDEE